MDSWNDFQSSTTGLPPAIMPTRHPRKLESSQSNRTLMVPRNPAKAMILGLCGQLTPLFVFLLNCLIGFLQIMNQRFCPPRIGTQYGVRKAVVVLNQGEQIPNGFQRTLDVVACYVWQRQSVAFSTIDQVCVSQSLVPPFPSKLAALPHLARFSSHRSLQYGVRN